MMKDFLTALAKRLKPNAAAYENYHMIYLPEGRPLKSEPNEPLRVNVLFQRIQNMLSRETTVIAETRDSWFNCLKLKLPPGCGYEFRCSMDPLVGQLVQLLVIPRLYQRSECLLALTRCITTKATAGLLRYILKKELIEAIDTATHDKKDCLCFIEVIVHKDDTSKELLEWGSRVFTAREN